MIQVTPIAITTILWDQYLSEAKKLLGRSVSEIIDQKGFKLDLNSFLISLSEFKKKEIMPWFLKHISASFLILCPEKTYHLLLEETKLNTISTEAKVAGFNVCIVTANLKKWKVEIACKRNDALLQAIMNQCQLYFERAGLTQVWSEYYKEDCNNGTYKLIEKGI